ncbi:MAG TPA: universal stress protein [Vicinamibacterales bacterium]|nr:universal stress protein [Vicinamibacterales bacterium]
MIPPRTILAPIDFSEASRASLQCAARLAGQWNAALHVLHVLDPLLATAAQTRHIDLVSGTRDELDTFCRDAGLDSRVVPTLHVVVGAAAEAICEAASAHHADLIVAGSRGLSGLNRLMMGTTIEHVIRRTHTSVLTVPGRCPGDDVTEWGPVIAAIDDPSHPETLAGPAAALAGSLAAPLHLVHVVPPLPALARWRAEAEEVRDARVDAAQRTLTTAISGLRKIEPSNVHVVCGTVGDTLAAEAGRHTRTLPILLLGRAAPGRGPAPGSVASRIIARATAAVWVYLPDADGVRQASRL